MTDKYDQAEYLANLICIMDSKEQSGLPKGSTLTKEYQIAYDDFVKDRKQEHKDRETRTKPIVDGSDESRAQGTLDRPGRNREDRDRPADSEDNSSSGPRRSVAES